MDGPIVDMQCPNVDFFPKDAPTDSLFKVSQSASPPQHLTDLLYDYRHPLTVPFLARFTTLIQQLIDGLNSHYDGSAGDTHP